MKKTMKRIFSALLCAVMLCSTLMLGVVAENTIAEAEPQVAFRYGQQDNGTYVTTTAVSVTVPRVPASSKALAWVGQINGEDRLLFEGDILELSAGDVGEFQPMRLEMTTEQYAEIRLNESSIGMRYRTHVSLQSYQQLLNVGVSVSFGTLIVPRNYVTVIGGKLTHEALDRYNKKRVDVAYDISNGWYEETAEQGTFVGSVSNMKLANYGLYYTAIGYAKLTMPNGTEAYTYADNGGYMNTVFYDLVLSAYNDRSDLMDATYSHAVPGGGNSPYTAAERQELRNILGNVIALKTDKTATEGYVLADCGAYYTQTQHNLTLVKDGQGAWNTYFNAIEDKEATAVLVISRTDGGDFKAGQYVVLLDGTKVITTVYQGKILLSSRLEFSGNH